MNLFATVLTYPAPSANYRGESEVNRSVIQKITDGRFDYPIFSPEAMRNALREILAGEGTSCRATATVCPTRTNSPSSSRLSRPGKYADDFFFGYLVAASGQGPKKIRKELEEKRARTRPKFTFKRDSVLRMNLAKGLEPYRHNAVFTQSPPPKDSPRRALAERQTRPCSIARRPSRLPVPVRPQPGRLQAQGRVDPQAPQGDRRAERSGRQPRPQLLRDGPGQHRRPAHRVTRRRLQHLLFQAGREDSPRSSRASSRAIRTRQGVFPRRRRSSNAARPTRRLKRWPKRASRSNAIRASCSDRRPTRRLGG